MRMRKIEQNLNILTLVGKLVTLTASQVVPFLDYLWHSRADTVQLRL